MSPAICNCARPRDRRPRPLVQTAASVGPSITMARSRRPARSSPPPSPISAACAQLGIIAGGGILLCWLAAMTVLPALIMLFDATVSAASRRPRWTSTPGCACSTAKPRLTLLAIVAATAALATGIEQAVVRRQPAEPAAGRPGKRGVGAQLLDRDQPERLVRLVRGQRRRRGPAAQSGLQTTAVGGTGRGVCLAVSADHQRRPGPADHRDP